MKKSITNRWVKVLKDRQKEVGSVRDKLRDELDEMTGLKESCERAFDDLQRAIDTLSELA